jgi:hypothetical protein
MQNSTGEQDWWFVGGHLYRVSFAPIIAGANINQRALGEIALGRELSTQSIVDTGAFGKSAFIFEGKQSVILSSLPASAWGGLRGGGFKRAKDVRFDSGSQHCWRAISCKFRQASRRSSLTPVFPPVF